MPIVHIELLEGRGEDVLRDLISRVTEATSRALSRPPSAVRVLVREVPAHLWGVGGEPVAAKGAEVADIVKRTTEPG